MKKHTYRSKNVNKINFSKIKDELTPRLVGQVEPLEPVTFAIDVAKEKQYALLSNTTGTVSELIWWNHPEQTGE